MARTSNETKMAQSRSISGIGCFGIFIALVILLLIGTTAVRAGINNKLSDAAESLALLKGQLDKTPQVLNDLMMSVDCGERAEGAVRDAVEAVDLLPDDYTFAELENAWDLVSAAWSTLDTSCEGELDSYLQTDMRGIRDRFTFESGKYLEKRELYNSAINEFPGRVVSWGFNEL